MTAVRTVRALGVATVVLFAAFVFVFWFSGHRGLGYAASRLSERQRGSQSADLVERVVAARGGVLCLGCPFQERDTARRRAWLLVAVAGLLLSMDEITSLHERLNGLVLSTGLTPRTFPWLIPGVFIAAARFLLLVRVGGALPSPARRLLLLALTVYAVGAIAVEAINGLLREVRWLYYVMGTTVEEALEMAACILAIGAIVNQLTTQPEATPLTARTLGERPESAGPPDQTPQQSPDHTPQPRRG